MLWIYQFEFKKPWNNNKSVELKVYLNKTYKKGGFLNYFYLAFLWW